MFFFKKKTLKILVDRSSVAAGDDIGAHRKEFELDASNGFEEIIESLLMTDYLPKINSGKATWVLESRIPLAIVAQPWDEISWLPPKATLIDNQRLLWIHGVLVLKFIYCEQEDPNKAFDRVIKELSERGYTRSSNGLGLWPYSQSKEAVTRWSRALKILRFLGMHGGHAGDFDEFIACIEAHGTEDLLKIMAKLGTEVTVIDNEWCGSPGWTKFHDGTPYICSIGVKDNYFKIAITVGGPSRESPFFRGEEDMPRIIKIDELLQATGLQFLDPPSTSERCVFPKNFPEIWK